MIFSKRTDVYIYCLTKNSFSLWLTCSYITTFHLSSYDEAWSKLRFRRLYWRPHEDMLIQCTASDVLFNQLLTWEYKKKSIAPMHLCCISPLTVLRPSHLIRVINLQQLTAKEKSITGLDAKSHPHSFAACIFILTVNKIGSSANLRKK